MRGGSSRHEYAVLDRGSACLQCKRRKKRCDGSKPVCGPCIRFGTADQCEFPRPPTPKLKPKPSPPRSKSEALRMQIRELEDQLSALQKAVRGKGANGVGSSSSTSHLAPPQQDDFDYEQDQQDDDMDDEAEQSPQPKVESPLQRAGSPDLVERADPTLLDDLMRVFLLHRRRCAFECDEGRFITQFHAPAGSTDAMHPGLVSAVLLIGHHFASTSASTSQITYIRASGRLDPALEGYFLQQTREHLAKSLTAADRLGDFLRGTALLVWYFFAKGRIAEAQYHASGVACFASACRLHLLSHPSLADLGQSPAMGQSTSSHGPSLFNPSSSLSNQPTQIIAPATSQVELEERISLFWTIFVLDRYASLICGTSPSLHDETIWTSWPRDPSEWELTRAEMQHTMLSPPPETLFPVLDYSSAGTADSSRTPIPRNDLSFRAMSAFLLQRSTHVAKAAAPSANQQAMLQRDYDMPYLQRTVQTTKAAARKMGGWLAPTPSSLLLQRLQLSGATGSAQTSTAGAGVRPQTGVSPQVFHTTSIPAPDGALRSSTYPPTNTSIFHQHPTHSSPSSSLPPSPHHHHRHPGSGGFGYEDSTSVGFGDGVGGFESPSDVAALLLAHSALDTAWIYLDEATRSLAGGALLGDSALLVQPVALPQQRQAPSIGASSGNIEYYRPPPSHSQAGISHRHSSSSSPSIQVPSRPASAASVIYHQTRHQQQQTQPHPQNSQAILASHQFQHPQSQPHMSMPLSSLPMPTGSMATSNGAVLSSDAQPWAPWNPTHDGGLASAQIPSWISAGANPDNGLQYPLHYAPQPSHQLPSQPRYTISEAPIASSSSQARPGYNYTSPMSSEARDMDPLVAARDIAELASAALGLPFVFDELDMMIAVTWTAALQVLSEEIRRKERTISRERIGTSQSRRSTPTHESIPAQMHLQQQQQSYYSHPTHYTSPSPIEHPTNIRGLAAVGDSDDLALLASIRDQRDILVHALDRLSGMFQLVGACSSLSPSSSSPTPLSSHRRTASSSSITSTSSSTSGAVSDRIMMAQLPSSMETALSGAELADCFGFGAGGRDVIFKAEADAYGSPSLRLDSQPYFPVLSGYSGEQFLAHPMQMMTPPAGQSPFPSSYLGSLSFNNSGHQGLEYFGAGGPSEPDPLISAF